MDPKILSDEEALKKANAVNWFDNKANTVSWINPNKSSKTFKRGNLEDLSVEQLQEKYALAIEQLKAFSDVPEDAKQFVSQHANKLFSFMLAIKATIKSKATAEQSLFMEQFEYYRKKAISKDSQSNGALKMQVNNLTNQLESLKVKLTKERSAKLHNIELADEALKIKVNNLTKQLESLKSARKEEKSLLKLRNIELANNREIMTHIEFKKLVKEKIGEIAYLSLIQEASVIADTKIELKNQKRIQVDE